jgi:hypothetical protein
VKSRFWAAIEREMPDIEVAHGQSTRLEAACSPDQGILVVRFGVVTPMRQQLGQNLLCCAHAPEVTLPLPDEQLGNGDERDDLAGLG